MSARYPEEGAANQHLQPVTDGLPARPSGSWAMEKLDYLRRYIDVFITSMRGERWRAIHFIDLFAGPGKCSIRGTGTVALGSPLLALTAKYAFSGYYFVDLDPASVDALRRRCAASPWFDRVRFLTGDANAVVNDIAGELHTLDAQYIPGRWSSLNLAFLDPAGIDLDWATVVGLAKARRMDLIIHYPQGGLNQSMPGAATTDETNAVDRFFGGPDWRRIYLDHRHGRGLHRRLIDHYKLRLQALGYGEVRLGDEVEYEPLMRNAVRKAPLYRLLFASRHALGHKFWQEVARVDVHGQKRMF